MPTSEGVMIKRSSRQIDLRYITVETSRGPVSRYSGPNLFTTWGIIEKMRTLRRTSILQFVLGPDYLGHESATQMAAVVRQGPFIPL